jgi:hypothetical protein
LNNIEICVICTGAHSTEKCPSLPEIKELIKENMKQQIHFMSSTTKTLAASINMYGSELVHQFPYYSNQHYPSQQYPSQQYPSQVWNSPMPWSAWPPQHVQHQPWKQGWHGHPYENMPTFHFLHNHNLYNILHKLNNHTFPKLLNHKSPNHNNCNFPLINPLHGLHRYLPNQLQIPIIK